MKYKFFGLFFVLAAACVEGYLAWQSLQGLDPVPMNEFWFKTVDNTLRDCLLAAIAAGLFYRRKRLPDRFRRYFPVVVVGVSYLIFAVYMVKSAALTVNVQTLLSVLAGLNNNILIVLLAAMCYHQWPTKIMKWTYFAAYYISCLLLIYDAFYFWQTQMHVESVLFQNLNYYAVKGVIETMDVKVLVGITAMELLYLFLFRLEPPQRRKPNFTWSLLCVAMFTIGLNIADRVVAYFGYYAVETLNGFYADVEAEKSRREYRNMIAMPVNVNFVAKALFDTDKLTTASAIKEREITAEQQERLAELGVKYPIKHGAPLSEAAYDRVVMIILESVHRDYFYFYNKDLPMETTPFMDEIFAEYPRIDNFYSSAVPTTQGLNSTFRSHVIHDTSLNKPTPSIYRLVQEAGMRGIFMNASSQYYANEFRDYKQSFGMGEYYAKEYLEEQGYTGASGWGFHNDIMYEETVAMLKRAKEKNDRLFMVTKTLDMHQPYPYSGYSWENTPVEAIRDNPFFTVRGMYWVDKTLEKLFQNLEKEGLMDDRTLYIITADHNPHSGGEYNDMLTNPEDKKYIAPIPLVFVSKNIEPLAELDPQQFASQIDIAPTVLHLLGLKIPELFMGRNLLEPVDISYAVGYFGGKLYYFSKDRHFVAKMDEPTPPPHEDALTDYVLNEYAKWHK